MDVTIGLSYFFILLQAFTGLVLLRMPGPREDRTAVRIFAILFLVNAAATVVLTLPRESAIWLRSDQGLTTQLAQALDSTTGPLMWAFLAARSKRVWAPRAVRICIAWAVALALAEFPFHLFLAIYDTVFRAIPFYAGLAAATWILASGRAWERWVSLALLTRALYWGTAGVADLVTVGWGGTTHVFLVGVNSVALIVLLIASLASAVKLMRVSTDPSPDTAVVILLIGPLAVAMETVVRASLPPNDLEWYGTVAIFNLLTLALVRPILTLIGVERAWVVPVAGRTALAAGIGSLAALFVGTLQVASRDPTLQSSVQFGFGLCVALVALATIKAVLPMPRPMGLADASTATSRGPAGTAALNSSDLLVTPAPPSDRSHWQLLVLALRGSHVENGAAARGEPRLTQGGLAAATGLRASRISTLVKKLNDDPQPRLDAYTPGWKDTHRGIPVIIQQYRGIVEGTKAPRVFYRLTVLGERLAAAIEASPTDPLSEEREGRDDRGFDNFDE